MPDNHICPITYEIISANKLYSDKGLKLLAPKLKNLNRLPYTSKEQLIEASNRSDKMSIQGVQPKLSAKLSIKNEQFELCDTGGNYILKPEHQLYTELPQNEDLTMRLAHDITDVPLHGLMYCIDGSFTYFIKRFDRVGKGNKIPTEDFAQLLGLTRYSKYDCSMEKIIPVIDKYCTFPKIEKVKLFTRVIFNYIVGNEDMHLKNYSLISNNNITQLAPAYDYLNTTLAIGINKTKEQMALSVNGKKNNLLRKDLIDYYGIERLELDLDIINNILKKIKLSLPKWNDIIEISFLSNYSKEIYKLILNKRTKIIAL
tara:strand:- start:93 stop:1037 length:945 start_codon:yes stop_codon:yes gene_type:complete